MENLPSLKEFMKQRFNIDEELTISSDIIVSAQYIADFADDQYIDDLIVKWTKPFNKDQPNHSHSEIGFYISGKLVFYSATSRIYLSNGAKTNGTRWIAGEDMLKNSERWNLYRKRVDTIAEIEDMLARADEECGKPYDFTGIAGFGSIIDFTWLRLKLSGTMKKWYCSRVAHYVETGQIIRCSPMRRTKHLVESGWEKFGLRIT